MSLADRLAYWMQAHPWTVGLCLCAAILFVGALDTPVELMEMAR